MQAKPPLACHANLVAEWGGVAVREGSGRAGPRELRLWVGEADESIMSKCNNEPALNQTLT